MAPQALRQALRKRWAVPILSGGLIGIGLGLEHLANLRVAGSVTLMLASVVAGAGIATRAWNGLRYRTIGIELLVTVAALGGALEATTLGHTRRALADLLEVAPSVAVVERDSQQVEIPAASVASGEVALVKAGAKIPVDGVVVSGLAPIDEASIIGESIPVEKDAGSTVSAGTISQGGFIRVEATGIGADTTLARVIHRVEEAQEVKARAQTFMERFSRWYTPGIMVLALVAGLITGNIELALTVLVIGCPGALVISIPVSIVASISRAARSGILMRGGEHLEVTARVTAVALDKTGTLTRGRAILTDLVVLQDPDVRTGSVTLQDQTGLSDSAAQPGSRPDVASAQVSDGSGGSATSSEPTWSAAQLEVLFWAAIAEGGSEHPLARPVLAAAVEAGMRDLPQPEQVEPHPGRGIVALGVRTGGAERRIAVGRLPLMTELGIDVGSDASSTFADLAGAGRTPMLVALDDTLIGALAVADEIRPDAAAMITELHRVGVKHVVMLSGDDQRVADAVAARTGIDEVHAGLMPEDKLNAVRDLQRAGLVVAMVGDGVNDAPALATADLGVAMGAVGSAVAIETADLALMSDSLLRLPEAIRLSRRTVATMRQNVVIALITVFMLLAGVLVGEVTIAVGMLVHQLSILIVIVNGMRLLRTPRRDRVAVHAAAPPADQDRVTKSTSTEESTSVEGLPDDRVRPRGARVS